MNTKEIEFRIESPNGLFKEEVKYVPGSWVRVWIHFPLLDNTWWLMAMGERLELMMITVLTDGSSLVYFQVPEGITPTKLMTLCEEVFCETMREVPSEVDERYASLYFTLCSPDKKLTVDVRCAPDEKKMVVYTNFDPRKHQPEWCEAMARQFSLKYGEWLSDDIYQLFYALPIPSAYVRTMANCERIFCEKIR